LIKKIISIFKNKKPKNEIEPLIRTKVKLLEGESYCEHCNGTGFSKEDNLYFCPHCLGTGKFDWIEKIVGKNSGVGTSGTSGLSGSSGTSGSSEHFSGGVFHNDKNNNNFGDFTLENHSLAEYNGDL